MRTVRTTGRTLVAAIATVVVAVGMTAVAAPAGADGGTGTISGVVVAADGGAPVGGICVTAVPPGPGNVRTTTAGDGTYTLSGLAAGPYAVEFTTGCGNTGNFAPQWWENAASQGMGNPVQVTSGATVTGIDAHLQTGATVSGTVAAAVGGAPVAGICVDVWQGASGSQGANPTATATTGGDGSYVIDGLAAGQYTVEFVNGCGDTADYAAQWWNGASSQMSATSFQLEAGGTEGPVDALLAAGGGIGGTVTAVAGGLPVQGVCVSVTSTTGAGGSAVTAADGTYSVTGLLPGAYDVEFLDGTSCQYDGGIAAGFEAQYYDGQPSAATATPVDVVAGTIAGPIGAQMAVGGSISGTVVAAAGGAPLQGICVSVVGTSYPVFGTAGDGSFTVTGLPTGTYTVQFSNGCGNPTSYTPQSVQVPVTAPGATTGVLVEMALGTPPVVTSVSPGTGPPSGGTPVTITGSGFTGASAVSFGPTPVAHFVVVSDDEITTSSPMGARVRSTCR